MSCILDDRRREASRPLHRVDAMDATHYPTRNVSDAGWKQRYWMDPALDETAVERTRTDATESPATAS